MTNQIHFRNEHETLLEMCPVPEDYIADEIMLYGASIDWCAATVGQDSITASVLEEVMHRIPNEEIVKWSNRGYHPVIDTKSVLLQKGQYPCIPGWHCDGVIRKSRGEQPDLSTLKERVPHYTCVLSSEQDTGTELLNIPVTMDEPDSNNVWRDVDKFVRAADIGRDDIYKAPSGAVCKFYRDSLHRCPPANTRQWRYFFRLSFYHMPAMNQIRKQVNIYTDVSAGW